MKKTALLTGLLLMTVATAHSQQVTRHHKRLMKGQVNYARSWRHRTYNQALRVVADTTYAQEPETARELLDSLKYSFVYRRATYSFSTGYHNSTGPLGIKFEDRLLNVNSHLQPGMGVGFSPIMGMLLSAGVNYFIVSEKYQFMPMISAQYIYTSGNRMASSEADKFYCITGKGAYLDVAAGLKIKPFAHQLHYHAGDCLSFESLFCMKLLAGYSFVLQNPGLDSLPLPEKQWDFKMARIRNCISGGFFFEMNIGIDIPYIKEIMAEEHIQKEEVNKY